jgi:hypothetical protein
VLCSKPKTRRKSHYPWTKDGGQVIGLRGWKQFFHSFGNTGRLAQLIKPDEYIEDVLPLTMIDFESDGVIYLSGETEKTVLGLGGSSRHLIGHISGESAHSFGWSLLPKIVGFLEKLEHNKKLPASKSASEPSVVRQVPWVVKNAPREVPPKERMDFFAKRLAYEPSSGEYKQVLLASPLYIADYLGKSQRKRCRKRRICFRCSGSLRISPAP